MKVQPAVPTVESAEGSPRKNTLGTHVAHGFILTSVQMIASKVVKLGGQMILAILLQPRDFGLIGLAFTVSTFADLIGNGGLRDVLVQRDARLYRWVSTAFWMSLMFGVVSMATLLCAAPFAARIYHEPSLVGVIDCLALSIPFNALGMAPAASLRSKMLFKTLSLIDFWVDFTTIVLSVIFAALHFGVYSFVWPMVVVAVGRTIALYWLAPLRIQCRLHWHRVRSLFSGSFLLFSATVFIAIVNQGDNVVLGHLCGPVQVGLYYFAFVCSMQTLSFIGAALGNVLLPALSSAQYDQDKQCEMFIKSLRTMAVIGLPACFLQAALTDPGIRLLFAPKWYPSIPLMQVLTVGNALRFHFWPAYSMFRAQRRYMDLLKLCAVNSVIFLTLVTLGAHWGAAIGVSSAVAIYSAWAGPSSVYFALPPSSRNWHNIWSVYNVALLVTVPLFIVTGIVMKVISGQSKLELLSKEILIAVLGTYVCFWIVRRSAPDDWNDIRHRIRSILRRRQVAIS